MEKLSRRAILGVSAALPIAGCLSEPTSDTSTEPLTRTTPTETNAPVERSLVIRNEFDSEQRVTLEIIEYRSGFEGDAYSDAADIHTVTATPSADEPTVRYDDEIAIDADGRKTVEDVFTLAESPHKYYLSVNSDDTPETAYAFIIQRKAGFRYLDISLNDPPEVVRVVA